MYREVFGAELLGKFCQASKSLATLMIPMQWLVELLLISLICYSFLRKDGVEARTRIPLMKVF